MRRAGSFAATLLAAHTAAVLFGLGGLLYAIPNPEWWSGSPLATRLFPHAVAYGGTVHIVLGALTVTAFGIRNLGVSNTLVFFGASVSLSLGMELLGTGTGWPFGAYEYTTGLGYQLFGRVPFTVPLSWFYMGLCSYLLAQRILERLSPSPAGWAVVALGAWLLTAWDLVLDPAMAHPDLAVRYWIWHGTGPYMGMPLVNFAGWALTAVSFMAISRFCWRRTDGAANYPADFVLIVYLVNVAFAIALSASISLWLPVFLAVLCGALPALLVHRRAVGPVSVPTAT